MHPWDDRFEKILKSDCPHFDATLFRKERDALVENDEMRPYISHALEATFALSDKHPVPDFSDAAMIVTGKFDIFQWAEAETDTLVRVIGLLKDRGMRVILRPHPGTLNTERYDGLDVEIYRADGIPFEASLNQADSLPKVVLGFASSAIVHANALYGIPAISLEELLAIEVKNRQCNIAALSAFMHDAKTIHESFGRTYLRPHSYEELSLLLNEKVAG